jgi:hypothetical protein
VRYTIEETYIYEVEADSQEEAQESFDEFMQANNKDEEEYSGVTFLQNTLNTYDVDGKEV